MEEENQVVMDQETTPEEHSSKNSSSPDKSHNLSLSSGSKNTTSDKPVESPVVMDQDENAQVPPDNSSSTPDYLQTDPSNTDFDLNDNQRDFILVSTEDTCPNYDHSDWVESEEYKVPEFNFTCFNGFTIEPTRKYTAFECFKFFIDDDIINMMVDETNKHAHANFISGRPDYHPGFLTGWMDVNHKEMMQFLGLLVLMGFYRLPTTTSYWSTDPRFRKDIACRIMTQTRFHRLLAYWFFGDDGTGTFGKINPLVKKLNENFRKYKEPSQKLHVSKRSMEFSAHKPSNPDNDRRPGLKILKLHDWEVYTYKVEIANPETQWTPENRVEESKKQVLQFLEGYLDEGRIFIFDELYVSKSLAKDLLKHKCYMYGRTHKVFMGSTDGTLVWGRQDDDGVTMLKWNNDAQDHVFLSTLHEKPKKHPLYPEYRVEEQLAQYDKTISARDTYTIENCPVYEACKWYRRVGCDLIINTAVINAFNLYKRLNDEKSTYVWEFRSKLFREMVYFKGFIRGLPRVSSDEEMGDPMIDC